MKRVWCYWNVKQEGFSVRVNGTVIDHPETLVLHNCQFRVWQGGRERTIREKSKNVHAFVVGTYNAAERPPCDPKGREVTYNPFKNKEFIYRDSQLPAEPAKQVVLSRFFDEATGRFRPRVTVLDKKS